MIVLGLTGGIGSGKSTLATLLAQHGAAVVDADRIARQVVKPGQPAFAGIVAHFGPGVVSPDGSLDRAALAAVVFNDAEQRAVLNALTHPVIAAEILRQVSQLGACAAPDTVTVVDIPLLSAATVAQYGFDGVVVVDLPDEVALRRLVEQRGMAAADARARLAAQVPPAERLALAGFVVDNGGTASDLEVAAEAVWSWARTLRA